MIIVKYRLIGYEDSGLNKQFDTRQDADAWIAKQVNIMVITIESSGVATLNRLYGG